MKYSAIIAVILVAIVAAWLGWDTQPSDKSENAPLRPMFKPGALPGFTFAATEAKRDSTAYTFTNKECVARIEVIEHVEAHDAETLMQDGVMGIQALYANALSPYPGDISNKVTTDPVFQPRLFRTTNGLIAYTYLLLYANDRFGYGATTQDSVKYKSLIGWFHCPAQKIFFKVKVFAPPPSSDRAMETMLTSLGCL